MRLKSKCNGCHRKLEIEGEAGTGSVRCPSCGGTVRLPQTILEHGQLLGDFKINRHIGSGSMGDVYLATQVSMERDVAIKILPPEIKDDPEAIESFLAEVRTLAKMDHQNIVTAFQAGDADGLYFLAMTYVDGGSLEDRLEAKGPIPEAESLYICLRVAQALRYAWDRFHIIHRDIKPENIMMNTTEDEPKILDLGISKIIGDDSRIQSETGVLVGTPHFMSPEQAEASEHLDFRSDMYSLGCTLYRLVTGKVPFDGREPMKVLMRHVRDPIPDPMESNPDLHPATAELIMQLMEKQPDDRFDDWTGLIDHLKTVLNAVKSPGVAFDTNTQPVKRRRRKTVAARVTEVLDDEEDMDLTPPVTDDEHPGKPNIPLIVLVVLSLVMFFSIGGIVGLEIMKRRASNTETESDTAPAVLEVHSLDDDQPQTLPESVEAIRSLTPHDQGRKAPLAKRVETALAAQPKTINEHTQAITSIQSLLKEAKGTPYAKPLQKRLNDLNIEVLLMTLKNDAEASYKAGKHKKAASLLRGYKGPYAEATSQEREAIFRKLRKKYRRHR